MDSFFTKEQTSMDIRLTRKGVPITTLTYEERMEIAEFIEEVWRSPPTTRVYFEVYHEGDRMRLVCLKDDGDGHDVPCDIPPVCLKTRVSFRDIEIEFV
jgi:hypothetical protein